MMGKHSFVKLCEPVIKASGEVAAYKSGWRNCNDISLAEGEVGMVVKKKGPDRLVIFDLNPKALARVTVPVASLQPA